jgi:hypothetical protein
MKKFIAAFDGLKFSMSTRDYAIQFAKQNDAHLVGVFLDDFTYHSYKIYDLLKEEGGFSEAKQKKLEEKDAATRVTAVKNFEAACKKVGVEYSLHHDRNIALQELLHESIYADLVIIESGETLTHYTEKPPTRFIRDLLSDIQCPVLVAPRIYKPVNKLILLYDGEPSSVFAIKMLSYSLSTTTTYQAEILSVNPATKSLHVPDNRLMKEFMRRHYPGAKYTVLKGLPEIQIVNYLKEQKGNPLIVLGAYRRSMVSRWFRESMADTLIRELKLPLFIAHNK